MSQQCVLHSRPFLEFLFTKLLFLEQTDSAEVPIVALRKQWTHDRAQMACHIPKTGWHNSMKKTRSLCARPPGWMAKGAKVSLSQRKYPCRRIATLLLQSTKSPVLDMNIQSLQIDLVQWQRTANEDNPPVPTLLSAMKRDSAGLQPTPTMTLPPRPPMVRMSHILVFDWDGL